MEVLGSPRAVREYERIIAAALLDSAALNLQLWASAGLLDSGRIDELSGRSQNG
jgi:hypothetical protein